MMDSRVVTIRPNYFYVDCNLFLNRELYKDKTNYDVYKYVSDRYIQINFKPTFEKGKDEVIFSVIYECGTTYSQQCYLAKKRTVSYKGDEKLGTDDYSVEVVDITPIR